VTNPFPTDRNAHRIALIDTAQAHLGWHLLSHVTMLHGLIPNPLFPDAGLTILGQAWSISIEWQFYLIAPLVIWLLRRGMAGIGGAALIAIGLVAMQKYTGLGDNSGFIGRAVGWFAIGIASYFAWMHRDRPNVRRLVALGAVLLVPYGMWRHEPGAIVWSVVMPTICGMLGRPGTVIARFLCWQPVKALGDVSYSTYMVHIFVLTGCMALANAITSDRTAYAILVVATSIPLIWLVSILSYRWLERPGIRTGSELAARVSRRAAKSPAQTSPATSDRP
jgi:peptidoglycan/LPS O-acetylase OafA/YrhL